MDGKDYVANAVRIVKDMLAVDGTGLSSKGSDGPMPITYRPECQPRAGGAIDWPLPPTDQNHMEGCGTWQS